MRMDYRKSLWKTLALGGCWLAMNASTAQAVTTDMHVESRTDLVSYDVSGPGSASSMYLNRGAYLQEFDFHSEHNLDRDWRSLFDFNIRLTDYDNFDTEAVSVEKMVLRYFNDAHQFDFGDYYLNLSQYSMNKSIKGAAWQVNLPGKEHYLRFAYGTFDSQWEYQYKQIDGEPLDRMGGGFRYQITGENHRLGLNVAMVKDREGDPKRTTENVYDQTVPAIDWEYRVPGLVINGEHAYSFTDTKNTANTLTTSSGNANRLSLRGRFGDLRLDGKVEQVATDFITLGGGATPDRFRTYAKADYKISKQWEVFTAWDFFRDNLHEQLSGTTRNKTAEAGFKWKDLFGRRTLDTSWSLRRKWTEKSDNSVDRISDRFKFGLTDTLFKTVRIKGDIETIFDDNKLNSDSPENYLYSLDLSSRHRLQNGDWELRPRLDLSHQERENISAGGDDITDAFRLNLTLRHKNLTDIGFDLERNDTDLKGTAAVDSVRDRIAAYWQYKFETLAGGSIRLEAGHNEYDFTDDSQDYTETIYKCLLRFSLDKKKGEE